MSNANKKKTNLLLVIILIVGFLSSLAYTLHTLTKGKNVALLNPKGIIAQEQYNLMAFTVTVLIAVVIATVFCLFYIAWRYRESNTKVHHLSSDNRQKTKPRVLIMWLIPAVTIFMLAGAMLPATQKLDPQKTIAADTEKMTIQVIALRWKWLFLYPEQGIATVNYVQIPTDTPITFELTADEAPMNSFWVPNLGGQLYAMTGHSNSLNLMANSPGEYPGVSAEINGRGFAGMRFVVKADTAEAFDDWVSEVRQSPTSLNEETYNELLKPSESNPKALYSSYSENLYAKVLLKYNSLNEGHSHSSNEGHSH